jgi:adenine phosphoribosyltransferase
MREFDARLRAALRAIPDHPKPGIIFQDITPLLADPALFRTAVEALAQPFVGAGITRVAGIEARGFIFAAPLAVVLGAGFIPIRKSGKLPWDRHQETYALEYGIDALEVHRDAAGAGDRVLIVDDVLATGGTAAAAERLLARLGAVVAGHAFLLEIRGLDGVSRLSAPAHRLLSV